MRKKIICIICCIMLVSSGCGLNQNIRNSIKYENNSKSIDKFKGLWISDSEENDILIDKDGKLARGMAYAGDYDFEGNVIKCIIGKNKIVVDKKIYFEIKDGKLNRYEGNNIVNTYSLGESLDKISTRINYVDSKESSWNDAEFNYDDLTVVNLEGQEEDMYNEDAEIDDIQAKYVKAIQDCSGAELCEITPDKNIDNFEYPENENSLQKELNELQKVLKKVYGNDVIISFEQSSFEEFSIQKLNNALNDEEDVDIIESLNKTIKEVIETGCNLQRCIKSDMTFKMSGENGEDTQTVSSYIYKVDEEYYIDTNALSLLRQGQNSALKEKEAGNSDYSTADLRLSDIDETDYSSLLLKYD